MVSACIKRFLTPNVFLFSFVGLLKLASLWAVVPVKVRPLISRSPKLPCNWDPHWGHVVVGFALMFVLLVVLEGWSFQESWRSLWLGLVWKGREGSFTNVGGRVGHLADGLVANRQL